MLRLQLFTGCRLFVFLAWVPLLQVRLCLDKKDYVRAQILSRKVSPRAFVERKGEGQGEIGIEGTAIEEADTVRSEEASAAVVGRRM